MPAPVDTQIAEAYAGAANPTTGAALSDAYAYCARLARSHYENFNVGGWITPREKLPHVYAVYAWCRTVDDLGDEVSPDKVALDEVDPQAPSMSRRRRGALTPPLPSIAWPGWTGGNPNCIAPTPASRRTRWPWRYSTPPPSSPYRKTPSSD